MASNPEMYFVELKQINLNTPVSTVHDAITFSGRHVNQHNEQPVLQTNKDEVTQPQKESKLYINIKPQNVQAEKPNVTNGYDELSTVISYADDKGNYQLMSNYTHMQNLNIESLNLTTLPMQLILPAKTIVEKGPAINTSSTPENVQEEDFVVSMNIGEETNNGDKVQQKSKCKGKDYSKVNKKNKTRIKVPLENTFTVQNYMHIPDRVMPPRAVAVLPAALQIRFGIISPRRSLPARVRFGPVRGVRYKIFPAEADCLVTENAEAKLPIFLLNKENECVTQIDVADKDKSNWLSLLNVGEQDTANVWLYEENDELYGVTVQPLPTRTPLLLGYSKRYSENHGLPPELPVIDLTTALDQKDDKPTPRRRYRCKQCTRTFSGLFALKRHTLQSCSKRIEKTDDSVNSMGTVEPNIVTNALPIEAFMDSTTNVEENRLPSDESLQNFTNSLDFSTSLFDTDRIPTLDMSGSSRSDEFLYTGYKDDNVLSTDLEFSKFDSGGEVSLHDDKKTKVKSIPNIYSPCPHCSRAVLKGKLRQHSRVCSARQRVECDCGQVFTNKEKLSKHIYSEHSTEGTKETETEGNIESEDMNKTPYKCEQCEQGFKRRGMLVNHLWRSHGDTRSAGAVPLARRVCHYPCAACRKLYRTAAKRDRHAAIHHPGMELVRAKAIESGTRTCEPAACDACPRQYATRAKLLQHIRKKHPTLAPPIRQNTSTKTKSRQRKSAARQKCIQQQIVY